MTRPAGPSFADRLRALRKLLPSWLPRPASRPVAACPVCLHPVGAKARRCSVCGEVLSQGDPLAALGRLGVQWPVTQVAVEGFPPEPLECISLEQLRLRELVVELLLAPGNAYATLRSPAARHLGDTLERYPHQIATVQRVLGDMGGRALLADEVGLGKTIEAGLVLAELQARQMCRRALILAPPALLDQWYGELTCKLGMPATRLQHPSQLDQPPEIALLSIYTARGDRFREALLRHPWDVVIVDEAHRLRNPRTQIHRFVQQLRARFLLLLTATPLHSSLRDLHTLVNLVRPGSFGSYRRFSSEFGVSQGGRRLGEQRRLRTALREVMVRNRRSSAGVALPPRRAAIRWIGLPVAEMTLYQEVTRELRLLVESHPRANVAPIAGFQRRLTSSPQAARRSLRLIPDPVRRLELEELLRDVDVGEKSWALSKLCALYAQEQILVFSEFRESVEAIAEQLSRWGESVAYWHGGMAGGERQRALAGFRSGACRILVGSDALAEGQNLQHARLLVNYDLPWNPFKIEQRIGRVHRLGQKREVFVISLVALDTFEAELARLLVQRLHLFELSVGELDPILGELAPAEPDFEQFLMRIALAEDREREERLGEFARTLNDAYLRRRELREYQNALPELGAMEELM